MENTFEYIFEELKTIRNRQKMQGFKQAVFNCFVIGTLVFLSSYTVVSEYKANKKRKESLEE